jgi:hypothetical protein
VTIGLSGGGGVVVGVRVGEGVTVGADSACEGVVGGAGTLRAAVEVGAGLLVAEPAAGVRTGAAGGAARTCRVTGVDVEEVAPSVTTARNRWSSCARVAVRARTRPVAPRVRHEPPVAAVCHEMLPMPVGEARKVAAPPSDTVSTLGETETDAAAWLVPAAAVGVLGGVAAAAVGGPESPIRAMRAIPTGIALPSPVAAARRGPADPRLRCVTSVGRWTR